MAVDLAEQLRLTSTLRLIRAKPRYMFNIGSEPGEGKRTAQFQPLLNIVRKNARSVANIRQSGGYKSQGITWPFASACKVLAGMLRPGPL
jgi:hypothetical protein